MPTRGVTRTFIRNLWDHMGTRPAGQPWAARAVGLASASGMVHPRDVANFVAKAVAVAAYSPMNVALAHTAVPSPLSTSRNLAVNGLAGRSLLDQSPATIITINSGFSGCQPTDPNLQTPSVVVGELRKLLLCNPEVWERIGPNLKWLQAPTVFYPKSHSGQANRQLEQRGFKYLVETALNYYLSYSTTILGITRRGCLPVMVGGDHSLAFSTVSSVNNFLYAQTGKTVGLIWVDAHGDINSHASTTTGNFHGGPVAALLGRSHSFMDHFMARPLNPKNIVYVAVRDLDPPERELIDKFGITVIGTDIIERDGLPNVMARARTIASHGSAGVCVSFDIDAVEKEFVPGTGLPVGVSDTVTQRGLTPQEAHEIAQIVGTWDNLWSFDLVEINPALDRQPDFPTVQLGAEILQQFLSSRGRTHAVA